MNKKYNKSMNHRRKSKKFLGIAVLVIAVIVAGSFITYRLTRTDKTVPLPAGVSTKSSPADNNLNNQRKASSSPASTLDNGATTSKTQTSSTNATITITRAGVVDNNLQVGSLVSGTTSGTCTLSAQQSGQTTITQTNQVTLENNSYACPVFNIPLSSFPNQGNWNVSIALTTNGSTVSASWVNNPVDLSDNGPS
jgi:hypothetical protein